MLTPLTALLATLAAFTVYYLTAWWRGVQAAQATASAPAEARQGGFPTAPQLGLGFVTNFFDTLGIGSFAPTTAVFKLKGLVPDEKIPGTLNVGHALPTITEALIFIAIVSVDVVTLTLMIAAAVAGSWFGAGVVSAWPRRKIQIGMGAALLVAATLFLMQIFKIAPPGGDTLSLQGVLLDPEELDYGSPR